MSTPPEQLTDTPTPEVIAAKAEGAKCARCPLITGKLVSTSKQARPSRLQILHDGPTPTWFQRDLLNKALELASATEEVEILHPTRCAGLLDLKTEERKKAITCCRPSYGHLQGQTIFAMGPNALYLTTGKLKVDDHLGEPIKGGSWRENGNPHVETKKRLAPAFSLAEATIIAAPALSTVLAARPYIPVFRRLLARGLETARGTLPKWTWPRQCIHGDTPIKEELRALRTAPMVAVDIETTKTPERTLLNVGFATDEVMVSVTWKDADEETQELVHEALAAPSRKLFWNISFDRPILQSKGFRIGGECEDLMLLHMLIAPGIRHSLSLASAYEFPVPRWKEAFKKDKAKGVDEYAAADPYERALYNARDCYVTLRLHTLHLYADERIESLYQNALANVLIAETMARTGIETDQNNVERLTDETTTQLSAALARCRTIAASASFNPDSHPQRLAFFRDTAGVSLPRGKSGNPTLDRTVLEEMAVTSDSERARAMARAILSYRSAGKKLSYLKALTGTVIHPQWRPGKAKTGRWASSSPNLMNIPKPRKDPRTKEIIDSGLRVCFKAREGKYLVELDYSALEARILALIAGDTQLLTWFGSGVDIHSKTAAIALRKDISDVSPEEREGSKQLRYAFQYGAAVATAHRQTALKLPKLTMELTELLFSSLRELHPAIVTYHKEALRKAKELDYVEDLLTGRRHYFFGEVDLAQVYNLPIQTFASGLIDGAVRALVPTLGREERLLLQIHDSLVCEGPDPKSLAEKMRFAMEAPISLNGHTVVFPTEAKYGTNWGSMKALLP